MRIKYGKVAIAIEYAVCSGKKLFFKTHDGLWYHSKDYYHENIAYSKLSDLVCDGWLSLDELYQCTDPIDLSEYM